MTRHDDAHRLRHMLDGAREAIQLSKGRTRDDLATDRLYYLAMVKLVEIIGEASARMSSSMQVNHAQIPWSQIVGARNRFIHGYDDVDLDILWDILELDLPKLVQQLQAIEENLDAPE